MATRYVRLLRNRAGQVIEREEVHSDQVYRVVGPDGKQPQPPYPAWVLMAYGTVAWFGTLEDMECHEE